MDDIVDLVVVGVVRFVLLHEVSNEIEVDTLCLLFGNSFSLLSLLLFLLMNVGLNIADRRRLIPFDLRGMCILFVRYMDV